MENDQIRPVGDEQPERDSITQTGSITTRSSRGALHCITIVGQIEGHMEAPAQTKTTKYEHIIPQITAVEEAEDIDGVEVDGQPLRPARGGANEDFDDGFDDDAFEDDAPKGGFKKFLNLFVTRVDEEDEEADEDEDEDGFDFEDEDVPAAIPTARPEPFRQDPRDIEGGQVEMDDMNKPTIDALQEQMAAELDE